MMEIPDRPFDKIMMDLVTDFTESNKGNRHILTIIDLLMGWPEAIPIPNKSADTITKAFIRHYLPRHLCPQFILSDNSMEFKKQTKVKDRTPIEFKSRNLNEDKIMQINNELWSIDWNGQLNNNNCNTNFNTFCS